MNEQQNPNSETTTDFSEQEPPVYYEAAPLGMQDAKPTSFAIASLVLGILSVVCCCFAPVSLTLGVLAIVFTIIDRRQHARFQGISIAGLVLGIVAVVLGAYSIIYDILNPVSQEDIDAFKKFFEEFLNQLQTTTTPAPAFRTLFHL